jgi:hypothetical protein
MQAAMVCITPVVMTRLFESRGTYSTFWYFLELLSLLPFR